MNSLLISGGLFVASFLAAIPIATSWEHHNYEDGIIFTLLIFSGLMLLRIIRSAVNFQALIYSFNNWLDSKRTKTAQRRRSKYPFFVDKLIDIFLLPGQIINILLNSSTSLPYSVIILMTMALGLLFLSVVMGQAFPFRGTGESESKFISFSIGFGSLLTITVLTSLMSNIFVSRGSFSEKGLKDTDLTPEDKIAATEYIVGSKQGDDF